MDFQKRVNKNYYQLSYAVYAMELYNSVPVSLKKLAAAVSIYDREGKSTYISRLKIYLNFKKTLLPYIRQFIIPGLSLSIRAQDAICQYYDNAFTSALLYTDLSLLL